jgi:hypothetical protein
MQKLSLNFVVSLKKKCFALDSGNIACFLLRGALCAGQKGGGGGKDGGGA